ncbi:hypothetical protein CRENBAI_005040 [Crenichthys baileyi]|uniref:Uncharacterized protein n=1 Tax=Crenichthys baileyi TaxID=28760 RepID=A0AAV9RN20_9TELE
MDPRGVGWDVGRQNEMWVLAERAFIPTTLHLDTKHTLPHRICVPDRTGPILSGVHRLFQQPADWLIQAPAVINICICKRAHRLGKFGNRFSPAPCARKQQVLRDQATQQEAVSRPAERESLIIISGYRDRPHPQKDTEHQLC